jgi:hypothetical protein
MKTYLCIAAALFLAACGKDYHTRDWYIEHDIERTARFKECENDPAQYLRQGSDCINAKDANGLVAFYGKEGALKAAKTQ